MGNPDYQYDDYINREFDEGPDSEHEDCGHDHSHPLKLIIERMITEGVPLERLPEIDLLLSHLYEYSDKKKLNAWIEAYIKLESRLEEDDD